MLFLLQYHASNTTAVQYNNAQVTNKKKLDSADLDLSLPEAGDTSTLCDSNQPLRIQYKQMLLVRLQMTATK